jgi:hypothetical protein
MIQRDVLKKVLGKFLTAVFIGLLKIGFEVLRLATRHFCIHTFSVSVCTCLGVYKKSFKHGISFCKMRNIHLRYSIVHSREIQNVIESDFNKRRSTLRLITSADHHHHQ